MSTLWHFKIDGIWYKIGMFISSELDCILLKQPVTDLTYLPTSLKNFQWFIMKSRLLLSYSTVNRLEYRSFFLPCTCLFLLFLFPFIHSFLPFEGRIEESQWHCRCVFTHLHLYCARFWNSVPYQVTFSAVRLLPHTTFFFTFQLFSSHYHGPFILLMIGSPMW